MLQFFGLNAGLSEMDSWLPGPGLATFHLMPDRGCVLDVSTSLGMRGVTRLITCVENFALLEASFVVIQILRRFPRLTVPADEPVEPIGDERQLLTLVVASADGCRVVLE
jgi:hypothetical protein